MGVESGQMLSHYRLVEKVGEGGMGVVWKAEDTVLNRTVAIKILPAHLALDEERRRMFLDEARLAASVSHAHIVQVYEAGRESDLDFIVMEYVEGQPLSRLLHARPLPPGKVADWGLQVAEGLARAHGKNLIHRDLKPANILVTPEGEVKIVDFGLATLFAPRVATGSWASTLTDVRVGEKTREIVGTLPYMSPEQVRGERLDARSDIFSLGAVLYEMTTGQRPFVAPTPAGIAQEIQQCRPRPVHELVPKVPLVLHQILEKTLARRPEERYQHMDDVAVDLQRLRKELDTGSLHSYEDLQPAHAKLRGPGRRIGVLAGIGVAAIALLAWFATSRRGREPAPTSAPAKVATIPERRAIAVLPFQNLSTEGAQAYFASGLHDELLTQLSKVAALKVISRTSVMGYQGTSMPPLRQIAEELGVGSIVEGSVQVLGGRLRVNVQLIDAATDEHLWAERYDRTLDDAFAIQSEVAQQIVGAVGAALTSAERGSLATPPTTNAEAYRFYLQGCEYLNRPDESSQNNAIAQQLYERALELDPNFALAHAMLSRVHGTMYWVRYDPSVDRAVRQREEAETALRLAPDLPQAHIAMGLVHYWGRHDYQRALDEFAIAIESMPSGEAPWGYVAFVNRRLGNWEQVFAAFEKLSQLHPRSASLFRDLGGQTYAFVGRYDDAVRAFDRALSLAPDLSNAAIQRGWTYVRWQGQLDTLRAALSRVSTDAEEGYRGYVASQRATLLLWERNPERLLQMLRATRVDVFDWWDGYLPSALFAAWAHQLRGEHAAAQAAFDSACVRLDAAVEELPDDWRVHAARGLSQAGLGRRDEALAETRWLQQSIVYREDAFGGPGLAEDRARILAQAGEAEASLDEIERLLAGPSYLNVHTLRLDPRWDPIREHPRFKALLTKYAER